MKTKNALVVIVAIFALTITAQAGLKAMPTGTVIVYRQWGYPGALARFQFNVDHGPNYFVRNGKCIRVILPVGDHIISHDHTFLAGQDPQVVHVEAGKTVYFQYTTQTFMSAIFEVADDQAQAAQTAATMKEQN